MQPGESATFRWQVQAPSGELAKASALTAGTLPAARQAATNRDERIVGYVPPPPPAGTDAVSDLPFLSATNGWGPVERDTSIGEQAAGDGHPITIDGVTYAKGLGTNALERRRRSTSAATAPGSPRASESTTRTAAPAR